MSPRIYMVLLKLTDRTCREHQNVSKSKCAKTEASNPRRLEVLMRVQLNIYIKYLVAGGWKIEFITDAEH